MQSCKLWATIFAKLKGEAQSRFLRLRLHRNYVWIWRRGGSLGNWLQSLPDFQIACKCFSDKTDFQVGAKDFHLLLQVVCWSKGGERGQTGSTGASKVVNCALCKERQVVCAILNLRNICFQGWVHMLPLQKKCSINNFILFSWNTTCPFFSSFRVERQLQKWIRHAKCFTMTLWECFLSRARVSRDISWLHFAH